MEPNLFRNRWLALAFVGLVAIGAAVLVGSEGEAGLLDKYMAGKPGEQSQPMPDLAAPADLPSSELVPTEPEPAFESTATGSFSDDGDLIDDADGFDTTPMVVHDGPDEEGAILEAEGEAVIVDPDVEGPEF